MPNKQISPTSGGSLLTRHLHESACAYGPSSFYRPASDQPACPSLTEVLGGDPSLAVYASAFADAQIDLTLAAGMDSTDYLRLLPDAPLGHVLLLRRLVAEACTAGPPVHES